MNGKINRMSISVDATGIKVSTATYECRKTKEGYIVATESNFGSDTTRLKESDIMQAKSNIREGIFWALNRSTWFFDVNPEIVKRGLLETLKEVAKTQADVALKLQETINNTITNG